MPNIRIINHITTEFGEYDHTDEWDRPDLYYHHCIDGFEIVPEKHYQDLTVGYEIDPTKEYYLLYATYSTGDTFHTEEGHIEYIGLYETYADAYVNKKRIHEHYDKYANSADYDNMFSIELISPSGTEYKQHVPWMGYFEQLEDVEIQPIRMV